MNIKYLKYHRKKANITQKELAKRVGVTDAYICMLERGERKNPDLQLLLKIAEELGISLQQLIGIENAG